ncbi:MAG: NAD(P)/FAD-dependent oxidoreductase [Eubacteriales bacterium]
MLYDVAIIGAGVVGSLLADTLSRYKLDVVVLEKEHDAAMGTSRANSAIVHAGFDAHPGTLKALLNVEGCEAMPELCEELDVPFVKNGSLVCAFGAEQEGHLSELLERGRKNGVKRLEILSGDRVRELEPNISPAVTSALYVPDAGIVCPYELTIGGLERAALNGSEVIFGYKVINIVKNAGNYILTDGKRHIFSRYVVNAAGLYSDMIAAMTGDCDYTINPRRGEYLLLDRKYGSVSRSTLFSVPTDKGKGILVSPTVDGNLLIGPNAATSDKEDLSTTSPGLAEITEGALKLVPSLELRGVITSFAGVRATPSTGDFIIRQSLRNPGVLHLSGIESPGLASSPAIARYTLDTLREMGLITIPKQSYTAKRGRLKPFRHMTDEERAAAISSDADWGKIVCRCESVTKAEIVDSIKRPCGATSLDGVKRRTRAGMGRCQGGFCSPKVAGIIAETLGIELDGVTKNGGESYILIEKVK